MEVNNKLSPASKSKDLNSYSLIEKLRKTRRGEVISATSQALYYELMAICNEDGWPIDFKCSNGELALALRINEKTLIAARKVLVDLRLITFESGKSKREFSRYSLLTTPILTVNNTANETTDNTENDKTTAILAVESAVNLDENSTDFYKLKHNQTIKEEDSSISEILNFYSEHKKENFIDLDSISESEKCQIKKLIDKHSVQKVKEAITAAAESEYYQTFDQVKFSNIFKEENFVKLFRGEFKNANVDKAKRPAKGNELKTEYRTDY